MRTMDSTPLLQSMPVVQRLALAYAPARAREPFLAFLALDARLASVVRATREPMLGQIRLAWWRDRLNEPASDWPEGEPLLALLASWEGQHGALTALVDGWEGMLGEAPLPSIAFERLADARAEGFAALASVLKQPESGAEALRLGRNWALADLAAGLSNPQERDAVTRLLAKQDWRRGKIAREMRPLVVLHGLAAPGGRDPHSSSATTMLRAMRLGLFGR